MAGAAGRAGGLQVGAAQTAATCGCRRQEKGSCLVPGGAGTPPNLRGPLPRLALQGRSAIEPCGVFNPVKSRLKFVHPKALGPG